MSELTGQSDAPDKREVGGSTPPRPIHENSKPRLALLRFARFPLFLAAKTVYMPVGERACVELEPRRIHSRWRSEIGLRGRVVPNQSRPC
jgi:hypothetical protein